MARFPDDIEAAPAVQALRNFGFHPGEEGYLVRARRNHDIVVLTHTIRGTRPPLAMSDPVALNVLDSKGNSILILFFDSVSDLIRALETGLTRVPE